MHVDPLNIVILPDEYLPAGTRVHAKMLHDLALEFGLRGHNVVVVTPGSKTQPNVLQVSYFEGVEVWRFRCPPLRGVGLIRRALAETLLSFRAWKATRELLKNRNFDLCINYSPTIFFAGYAYLLKRKGSFVYLILRDFFPQWVLDQGKLSFYSPVYWYFRSVEILNYKISDVIALQSPSNEKIFNKKNRFFNGVTHTLYNWTSATEYCGKNNNAVEFLNRITEKTIFFYGGNMGHAQDMGNLLRLARSMKEFNEAHFLLVGDGDQADLVQEAARVETNISFFKSVPQDVFSKILQNVDIGLFTLAREHTTHNFPGKILGYMNNKVPILGSVNPGNDLKQLIENSKAGIIVDNGQDEKLLRAALLLLKSPHVRSIMGANARDLRDKVFSVEGAVDEIIKKYDTLGGNH
jgi:O26-antigen biosynthesis N-acetyl-L-fucosamine transferase